VSENQDQKLLVRDLAMLEEMAANNTNLLIHIMRIKENAAGGYYHLGRKKVPAYIDQALNESDGVYRP